MPINDTGKHRQSQQSMAAARHGFMSMSFGAALARQSAYQAIDHLIDHETVLTRRPDRRSTVYGTSNVLDWQIGASPNAPFNQERP